MRELPAAIIITIVLLALGGIAFYFETSRADFNFYKAELTIQDTTIKEKLYFNTDNEYHTLYRNFADKVIAIPAQGLQNYIEIKNVSCQAGSPYTKNFNGIIYEFPNVYNSRRIIPYTEPNEYGCTFGNSLGFKSNQEYTIEAQFELHPQNLFQINGKNYIKFVAYSSNMHKKLSGSNLVINSNANIVSKKSFYPKENVIIYIPFEGDSSSFNIIPLQNFEFDSSQYYFYLILALFPGAFFAILWIFFGKENSSQEIPDQLSVYPQDRKAWEIASYFSPPFSVIDKNFISSIMIDFYHRKVIDIKIEKKKFLGINADKVFIKLNEPKALDDIEKQFFDILIFLKGEASEKQTKGEYFGINGATNDIFTKNKLRTKVKELQKKVKKNGKQYLDLNAQYILKFTFLALLILNFYLIKSISFIIFFFLAYIIISILNSHSVITIRYRENFYNEYRQWRSFRKYLSQSFTIKTGNQETIRMWGKYLVFATALGVSEKVLKELKEKKFIGDTQYAIYTGINTSSGAFAVSAGTAGGAGGGHGGAGGGGVGGGGGGGR